MLTFEKLKDKFLKIWYYAFKTLYAIYGLSQSMCKSSLPTTKGVISRPLPTVVCNKSRENISFFYPGQFAKGKEGEGGASLIGM